MRNCSLLHGFLVCLLFVKWVKGVDFDVTSFGAMPNIKKDSSSAFLRAWNAVCASASPATLYVPAGQFTLLPVQFRGPCKSRNVRVRMDGGLVASTDYRAYSAKGYWLKFADVKGLTILGGNLDGNGAALWACKAAKKSCPNGARTLLLSKVQDAIVAGLTSVNSQLFHVVMNGCTSVAVQDLKIIAPDESPNTDGVHVQTSTAVTISNVTIKTGDDCISIGPGTRNLWIERVACGPGHGISIGSLGKDAVEEGVQNITVKNVVLTGSQNGLRIKSWERMSTGFVKGVLFQKAIMNNVKNPIIIDQNYCPGGKNCPTQTSGVKISDVTYTDIRGTSATKVAVNFACSSTVPCQGIVLTDVQLTYGNKPATSVCKNAFGVATGIVLPPSCL